MNEPMNCADFHSRLKDWLAGDIDEAASAALEAHLNSCAQCQKSLETANEEDQALRGAIAEPQAAVRVARRTAKEIERQRAPSTTVPSSGRQWRNFLLPLLSAAAGIFIAMCLPRLNPPAPVPNPAPPQVTQQEIPQPPPVVAHLVAATGRVERYDDQKKDWVAIDPIKYFECPTDSRVRTTPNVRCELKTGDGCVIRLNDQTEVKLLGSSSIELHQGQVWCRSPQESSLEVRVATTLDKSPDPKAPQPTMWSVGPSSAMTCIEKSGQVQVVSAEGEINLRTAAGEQRLSSGQVAEISDGQVIKPGNRVDPLLATSWMQPLLVSRGADNAELQQRVDTLLAQIGRAKIATYYEQEIRSLGEHAVLPLVRFIQSPLAAEDPRRRSDAMRIIADLAPVWLIPDLIDLLEDREGYVRQLAAGALFRLTALDMQLSPADWRREPDEAQATAVKDWRNWWAAHRDQFPRPQVRITRE